MNVGKLVGIFGIHDEGFIEFNKWKQINITKVVQTNYSASDNPKILAIMNYLMSKMNLSKNYKVL